MQTSIIPPPGNSADGNGQQENKLKFNDCTALLMADMVMITRIVQHQSVSRTKPTIGHVAASTDQRDNRPGDLANYRINLHEIIGAQTHMHT